MSNNRLRIFATATLRCFACSQQTRPVLLTLKEAANLRIEAKTVGAVITEWHMQKQWPVQSRVDLAKRMDQRASRTRSFPTSFTPASKSSICIEGRMPPLPSVRSTLMASRLHAGPRGCKQPGCTHVSLACSTSPMHKVKITARQPTSLEMRGRQKTTCPTGMSVTLEQ